METRKATINDVNALVSFTKALFQEYRKIDDFYPVYEGNYEDYKELKEDVLQGKCTVVEHNTFVVGMLKASMDKEDYCYVHSVYVVPEYRGKGVGSALVKDLKEKCKVLGVPNVFLQSDVRSYANEFWKKQGFTPFSEKLMLNL